MKKETTKKSKLWLWLLIGAVALVAVAGVVLAMLLGGGKDTEEGAKGGRPDLYWNVDKALYTQNSESGLSTREPGADGVYTVRFAYNGDLLELPVADKQLINYIDTMDCMGIVQDADGVVIDAVDPKTLATETAKMFYVRKVENGVLSLNSSMAMNGMSMDVPVVEVTECYDVTDRPEKPGQKINPEELEGMDSVTVYSNDLGEATHVFVVSHPVESPVYWRADTGKYNSTDKKTTRVPDEEGYYTVPFYVNGEYVELKCNKEGIVNTIDAKNRFKAHTGLVLDENGYIVDNMLAATGIRGLLGCEMYEVTEVDGKTFTAEAQLANNGETYTNTLTDDAAIYDVSLAAKPDVRGKATESLKVGDRIVAFENSEGEVMLVFVAHRLVDSPMYFNMTKKYSSAKKETTRKPDGAGWYSIEMFSEGVTKTYKTQDKELVNKIDSQNNRAVGLELEGDVITYVWEGECVAGYGALVGYSVQNVTGSIISMTPPNDPENVSNRILHPTAKVYNMSGVKQKKGEITELLPEDYCIFWRNPKSELVYVYVIRRKVDAPIYFSLSRKWDSTNQRSTREPVDGWFVYECASEGKHVTVKTKSREAADFLDSQSPQTFALKVDSNGVIQEYYETIAVTGGSKAHLNTDVKKISGGELTVYNPTTDKTATAKLAEGYKVFNVSSVYETIRGEKGSVQVNDRIQTYTNIKGEIVLIYIRQRTIDADIYFSKERVKEVTAEGKTARQPDADGWYVFQCALKGEEVTVKTKDIDKATLMDAQSPQAFALKVDKDGVIQKAYPATAVTGGSTRALNAIVKSVDGGKITVKLTNGDDFEMPMASSYEVYNVSGVFEDHWGEKSTIQVGDSLQSYTNKENKICLVYIRTRPDDVKLYWNVDQQYDKEKKMSTRTRQADGYFHVMLSVEGEIQEFLVEDQKVINYIDSANGAVACTVKNGIITKAQAAIYAKGVWASTEAAVIGTVYEVKDGVLVIKDSNNEDRELKINAQCQVYDVSANADPKGVKAEPKVGDYGRFYLNMDKEALYFYIQRRGVSTIPESKEPLKLYWNVKKDVDPAPDAQGYFHFEMAVGGKIEKFKTMDTAAAEYADNAGGAVALTLSAEDSSVFTKAQSALFAENVEAAGVSGTVTAVDGKTITVKAADGKETKATLAEKAQVYDVSGTGEFIGVATEVKAKDGMRSYVDENGAILYLYVTSRGGSSSSANEGAPLFWNIDQQYDKENKMSTRTRQPDGYFHVKLALDGEIKEYLVEDQKVINYIDSANGAVACTIKNGVITKAQSAIYGKGVWSSVEAAVIGTVFEVKDGTLLIKDLNNTDRELKLNAECQVYDVSAKADTKGMKAEPKAGDYGRFYLNMDKEVMYFYIQSRGAITEPVSPDPVVLYWNLNRNVDPVADADGYYHFKMAVGGEIKDLKTKDENAANYADGANGAVALTLSANDPSVFVKAESGLYADGVKTTGATGKVSEVTAAYALIGTDKLLLLTEDTQVYDVSGKGAFIGELTELKAGDNIARAYVDEGGYALYVYVDKRDGGTEPTEPEITYDNSNLQLDADNKAMCTFCGETVEWFALEKITVKTDLEEGKHYYLAADITDNESYYVVKNNCVHLNGHNITSSDRVFHVSNGASYLLTIMGNGTVTGASASNSTANEAGATISVRGNLNLIGGTYKHINSTLPTIIMAKPQQIMNIYKDVIIEGTEGVTGTNLYVMMGVVNLHGGKIIGGTATPDGTTGGLGDNVYVHGKTGSTNARAEFNMIGGYVDGGIYATKTTETYKVSVADNAVITDRNGGLTLDSASGAILTVGALGADAQVYVTGNGAITDEFANAAAYVNTKILPAANVTLTAEGNVIMAAVSEPEPVPVWKMAWVVEPKFDETNGVTTRTPDADGYYYVELSIDGVTKTYKTKEIGLLANGHGGIDYVDQSGSKDRAVAICLLSADSLEFSNALGATNHTGATGARAITVSAIENGVITGGTYTGKVAENGKIFDVSSSATVEGEISELRVGDYGRFYTDSDGNILYGYIYTRVAVEPETTQPTETEPTVTEPTQPVEPPVSVDMDTVFAKAKEMDFTSDTGNGVEAECPACGKTVTWTALPVMNKAGYLLAGGHYYVAADIEVGSMYYSIKDGVQVCINLNNKTIKTTERVFYADKGAVLTVMGSGNVIGGRSVHPQGTQRCGSALEIVGKDTIVNLCGGTWSKTKDDLDVVGVRAHGNGCLNIFDGTAINVGEVQGNALLIASGSVNLTGGEINGNVYVRDWLPATATVDYGIRITASGTTVNGTMLVDDAIANPFSFVLSGDVVINELIPSANHPLSIGRLTVNADVKVNANGVFTQENANLQDYVNAGFLTAKAEGKTITVTDGVASVVDATATGYNNANLVFEEGTTKAMCPWCGEVKEWTALESTADGNTDTLSVEGGHYYLAEDQLTNAGRYNVTATTCIHLNGHNVTNTANRVFSVNKNIIATIMGNGTVTGSNNATTVANVAAATISSLGELNLVGGTYCSAETSTLPTILEARGAEKYIKVYDGVTITGGADKAGLSIAYGHLIMNGGTIDRLDVLGQDIGGIAAQCTATLLGGTVEKVCMAARDPEGQYANYMLDLVVGGTAKAAIELAEGAKITISEEGMKKGAEIFVTAVDGAISKESPKAAHYLELGYFKAADESKTITEQDGILSIG